MDPLHDKDPARQVASSKAILRKTGSIDPVAVDAAKNEISYSVEFGSKGNVIPFNYTINEKGEWVSEGKKVADLTDTSPQGREIVRRILAAQKAMQSGGADQALVFSENIGSGVGYIYNFRKVGNSIEAQAIRFEGSNAELIKVIAGLNGLAKNGAAGSAGFSSTISYQSGANVSLSQLFGVIQGAVKGSGSTEYLGKLAQEVQNYQRFVRDFNADVERLTTQVRRYLQSAPNLETAIEDLPRVLRSLARNLHARDLIDGKPDNPQVPPPSLAPSASDRDKSPLASSEAHLPRAYAAETRTRIAAEHITALLRGVEPAAQTRSYSNPYVFEYPHPIARMTGTRLEWDRTLQQKNGSVDVIRNAEAHAWNNSHLRQHQVHSVQQIDMLAAMKSAQATQSVPEKTWVLQRNSVSERTQRAVPVEALLLRAAQPGTPARQAQALAREAPHTPEAAQAVQQQPGSKQVLVPTERLYTRAMQPAPLPGAINAKLQPAHRPAGIISETRVAQALEIKSTPLSVPADSAASITTVQRFKASAGPGSHRGKPPGTPPDNFAPPPTPPAPPHFSPGNFSTGGFAPVTAPGAGYYSPARPANGQFARGGSVSTLRAGSAPESSAALSKTVNFTSDIQHSGNFSLRGTLQHVRSLERYLSQAVPADTSGLYSSARLLPLERAYTLFFNAANPHEREVALVSTLQEIVSLVPAIESEIAEYQAESERLSRIRTGSRIMLEQALAVAQAEAMAIAQAQDLTLSHGIGDKNGTQLSNGASTQAQRTAQVRRKVRQQQAKLLALQRKEALADLLMFMANELSLSQKRRALLVEALGITFEELENLREGTPEEALLSGAPDSTAETAPAL